MSRKRNKVMKNSSGCHDINKVYNRGNADKRRKHGILPVSLILTKHYQKRHEYGGRGYTHAQN